MEARHQDFPSEVEDVLLEDLLAVLHFLPNQVDYQAEEVHVRKEADHVQKVEDHQKPSLEVEGIGNYRKSEDVDRQRKVVVQMEARHQEEDFLRPSEVEDVLPEDHHIVPAEQNFRLSSWEEGADVHLEEEADA